MRTKITRVLLLLVLVGPLALDAQNASKGDQRAESGRARVAELVATGAEGQLVEQFPGSYVFVPAETNLPQIVVANPSTISSGVTRRPLIVLGRLDPVGRLEVSSFRLQVPQMIEAAPPRAKAAATKIHTRLFDMMDAASAVTRSVGGEPPPPPPPADAPPPAPSPPPPPITDDEVLQQVIRLESSYREALAARDLAALRDIAKQWVELRAIIVDPYAVHPDTKAIYGDLDNYAPWRYDVIFRQSQAVVALGDAQASVARCSGVLLAADLVLTAAHCFSGPPARAPRQLEVWFGFAEQPGTLTPQSPVRRAIQELVVPGPDQVAAMMDGQFNADLLDYAIVQIAPLAGAEPAPAVPCVRRTQLSKGDAVYVVGYPQGTPVKVHDSGRVYLPYRILEGEFARLRMNVQADMMALPDAAGYMKQFDESYDNREVWPEGLVWRVLRHVRDGGQPRMGIVVDTFHGDSGGPVYEHDGGQCLVGILIGGASDTGIRRNPNWREHERVLPLETIVTDLQRKNRKALLDRLTIQ